MLKKLFALYLVTASLSISAQENSKKIKIQSANLGFGGYYFQKNDLEGGGATFIADLTFAINKNLISTTYLTGAEIGIISSSNYNFNEFSVSYGRELKLTNWFSFEGFAGVGYYNQKSEIIDVANDNSISFPLKLNSKFYFTKKFGMGFNSNYSINSVNNNFSTNLIFHYRFN